MGFVSTLACVFLFVCMSWYKAVRLVLILLESMGELDLRDGAWEKVKTKKRATIGGNRSMKLGSKRLQGSRDLRPLKRLKFDLIQEGLGSLTKEVGQTKTTPEGGGGIRMVKDGLITGSYDGMVQPTDVDKDGGGIIAQPPPSSPPPTPIPSVVLETERGGRSP